MEIGADRGLALGDGHRDHQAPMDLPSDPGGPRGGWPFAPAPERPQAQAEQVPRRGLVDISERPAVVEAKSRAGDWETDTIIWAGHEGVIVSAADRISKRLWQKSRARDTRRIHPS